MSENDSSESDIEMDPEEEKVYRRQVEESDVITLSLSLSKLLSS